MPTSNTVKLSSEFGNCLGICTHLTYLLSLYEAAKNSSEYKAEEAAGKHGAVYTAANETLKAR